MDLRDEFIKLVKTIGRTGLLRKTTGSSPITATGEYDPNDARYWEGRSYKDYEIKYYWTRVMSGEVKTPAGPVSIEEEVCFIAANPADPQPTQKDTLVQLKHGIDGVIVRPFIMDSLIQLVSVMPYWADAGKMVFYVASRTRDSSGWSGRA